MKKPVFKKRDLIELSLVVIIFAVIFLTNSQAEVFGRVQGVVLKTGIFNASGLEEDEYLRADYDFKVRDENGQLLDGESLRGKTIFMNLWATWCPPCVAEMPSIDALYHDFKEQHDIVFLIISEDKDFNKAKTKTPISGKTDVALPDLNETMEQIIIMIMIPAVSIKNLGDWLMKEFLASALYKLLIE